MNTYSFRLAGAVLAALPSGALWWADAGLLAVSDLHLGRSDRIARLGGALIPPYEAAETLSRLDALIGALVPRVVVCLGDSFDDPVAAADPDAETGLWLARMMAGRRWVWIAGNHDPVPLSIGGECHAALTQGPLTFRHIAAAGATGEVSGHFHPKARVGGQSRRCFLIDGARVILPAFGAYTGGLWSDAPVLAGLMGPGALAILTGTTARPVPMPR
jgi:hypothetical protein